MSAHPWQRRLSGELTKDLLLAAVVSLIALLTYAITLAPSVQPGDVAELQYIVDRLGIPHPNGYPFYILLGKAWSFLPLGDLAWRMNLFSAVLAAGCVGLTLLLLRATGLGRIAALSGALLWAFQGTFWTYAGLAHRYSLWMFLGVGLLLALVLWRRHGEDYLFLVAALLMGLGLASHIASLIFLLPAVVLILWPGRNARLTPKALILASLFFLVPLVFYAYIPLRGPALWRASAMDPIFEQPEAVLQGLIHPRFGPRPSTMRGYMLTGLPLQAGAVIEGTAGNAWSLGPLAESEFGIGWIALAAAGGILSFLRNRAWALSLFVLFVTDVFLATNYRQGNLEAYYLPAAFVIAAFLAELLHGLYRLIRQRQHRRLLQLALGLVALALPLYFLVRNAEISSHRDDLALDRYWRTVLQLPLEQKSGLIAHWSDLTPLWYFQQAEGMRPDLQGLYLPDEGKLEAALHAGRSLYIVGPLKGWYSDLPAGTVAAPWGPIVRLSLQELSHQPLPVSGSPLEQTLGDRLVLRSPGWPAQPAVSGTIIPVTLAWESLKPLDPQLHVSLRLYRGDHRVAQQDDRVVSAWYPGKEVPPELPFWSLHELAIPSGTPPGEYTLRAVVYDLDGAEFRAQDGPSEVTLGTLSIVRPEDTSTNSLSSVVQPTLGRCLTLESATTENSDVLVGEEIALHLLWRTRCESTQDVAIRFVYKNGDLVSFGERQPLSPDYSPTQWRESELATTIVRARVPMNLPPGPHELAVELVDPDTGAPLGRQWWFLPLPGRPAVASIEVSTRPYETAIPALANRVDIGSEVGIGLLGYEWHPDAMAVDQPLDVTAALRADGYIPKSYTVFLHLLAADGSIVAQRDSIPRGGTLPTDRWLPGEVVVDSYQLLPQESLDEGSYTLIFGLYDSKTLQRLQLQDSNGQWLGDHVTLGSIHVSSRGE